MRKTSRSLVIAGVGGLLAISSSAFAAGPDFTSLTSSVDFGTVGTAVLAMAALMIVPLVASWGAKKVMGFIRG